MAVRVVGIALRLGALGVLGRGVNAPRPTPSRIEAVAGMSRPATVGSAAVRFFRPGTVVTPSRGNVLYVSGDAEETGRHLVVDRDGARLTNFRGRPVSDRRT